MDRGDSEEDIRWSDVIPYLPVIPVYGLCRTAAFDPIGIKRW